MDKTEILLLLKLYTHRKKIFSGWLKNHMWGMPGWLGCLSVWLLIFFFFFNVYSFWERVQVAEGRGESIPSRFCAVSTEPNTGLNPTNREVTTWAHMSHPGALSVWLLISAQVMIPGSCDWAPHQAPHWAWSLLKFLSLSLPPSLPLSLSLPSSRVKKTICDKIKLLEQCIFLLYITNATSLFSNSQHCTHTLPFPKNNYRKNY